MLKMLTLSTQGQVLRQTLFTLLTSPFLANRLLRVASDFLQNLQNHHQRETCFRQWRRPPFGQDFAHEPTSSRPPSPCRSWHRASPEKRAACGGNHLCPRQLGASSRSRTHVAGTARPLARRARGRSPSSRDRPEAGKAAPYEDHGAEFISGAFNHKQHGAVWLPSRWWLRAVWKSMRMPLSSAAAANPIPCLATFLFSRGMGSRTWCDSQVVLKYPFFLWSAAKFWDTLLTPSVLSVTQETEEKAQLRQHCCLTDPNSAGSLCALVKN